MFSKIIKLLLASSLIAVLFNRGKKDEGDDISKASEAFENVTTQSDQNRDFVEVPENNNQTADNTRNESEPFIQSPG